MAQKLIVTGYGGFVAGSVVWQAGPEWEVHAFSRKEKAGQRKQFRCWQFDLRERQRLQEAFATIRPDAVIHTAALANIDYCEQHQEEAQSINVGVTGEIAALCKMHNTKMILCSTDTVFDGTRGMYTEKDKPHAVNFYAKTKIEAEDIVRSTVPQAVIARLSLVMGLPVMWVGNSFLAKMINSLKQGAAVKFPANEIRTPVDVITLGRALLELARNDFVGTLHLAGNTRLNRYEMACCIAEKLGYSRDRIIATDSNTMAGRAPRPNDASLDNTKAKHVLGTPMRSLEAGLELVLEVRKLQEKEVNQ